LKPVATLHHDNTSQQLTRPTAIAAQLAFNSTQRHYSTGFSGSCSTWHLQSCSTASTRATSCCCACRPSTPNPSHILSSCKPVNASTPFHRYSPSSRGRCVTAASSAACTLSQRRPYSSTVTIAANVLSVMSVQNPAAQDSTNFNPAYTASQQTAQARHTNAQAAVASYVSCLACCTRFQAAGVPIKCSKH
jgi:hypothetical protein